MVKEHRLNELKKAINDLITKAKEDGIITTDEQEFIDKTKANVSEYERLVAQALEDGIITQDERNTLIELEEKILSDAYDTALSDNILTQDEANLLKILIKSFDPKASIDWIDEDVTTKEE